MSEAYIRTISGNKFFFHRPEIYPYNINEIAHALSLISRFAGHVRSHYSVAQHSVLCYRVAPDALKKEALLHDAHEAFVGDLSSPLKSLCPSYRHYEALAEAAVRRHFGLIDSAVSPGVKGIDYRMAATEQVLVANGVPGLDFPTVKDRYRDSELFIKGEPIVWCKDRSREEFLLAFDEVKDS